MWKEILEWSGIVVLWAIPFALFVIARRQYLKQKARRDAQQKKLAHFNAFLDRARSDLRERVEKERQANAKYVN